MCKCPKCNGTGLVHWDYKDGKCFCCDGTGEITQKKMNYINNKKVEFEKGLEEKRVVIKAKEEQEKQNAQAKYEVELKNGYDVEMNGIIKRLTKEELENLKQNAKILGLEYKVLNRQ